MGEKQLHIKLFGQFRLEYNGELITELNSSREQELCTYLLLNSDTPVKREYISFQFWPESSEKQAKTNLRNVLYHLRKKLPESDRYVIARNKILQWNRKAPYELDVENFEEAIEKVRRAESEEDDGGQLLVLERAESLYRGELFEDCYKKWIEPERERLKRAYRDVLKKLVRLLEKERDYQKAIPFARKLIEYDSFEEAAYRDLMRLYALNDERARAVKTYVRCSDILRNELDIAPSDETRNLYENLFSTEKSGREEEEILPYIRGSQDQWPFIGRREEWEQLIKNWKRILAGDTRFLLIKGEPGIGKSRLGFELKEYLEKQGYQSIYTRLYASAENVRLGLAIDCLREESVYRQVKEMDSVWLRELVRILPEIKIDHPEIPDPEPIDKPDKQSRFLSAVSEVFLHDGKPKLLFLDDLQWCDPESLEWLSCLLHHPKSSNILVAGSVRPVESKKNQPLQQFISMIRQEGRIDEISLQPLKKKETVKLARAIDGQNAPDDDFGEMLYRETEGNPLFVVEYLRQERFRKLSTDSRAKFSTEMKDGFKPLPERVEAVISARFEYLSDRAWELMNLAATIGRNFSFELLSEVSGRNKEEVIEGIDELLQHQIIREQGTGTFDFSHDKMREVAYNEMSETRRRWNHRRIAEAVEVRCNSEDEGYYSTLGFHFERSENLKRAVEYYRQAARKARNYFSKQDIVFYKRAIKLLEKLPESENRDRMECDLRVGLSLSLGHFKGVDLNELFEISSRINTLCNRLKEPPPPSVLYTLARGNIFSGKISEAEEIGEDLYNQARKSGNNSLLVQSHYIQGFIYFLKGNFFTSEKYIREGLEHYDVQKRKILIQHSGHDTGLLLNTGLLLIVLVQEKEKKSTLLEKIHRIAQASEDPYTKVYGHYLMTTSFHLWNNVPETGKHAEALISHASGHEYSFWKLTGKILLGWAYIRNDNIKRGLKIMREGIEGLRSQNMLIKFPYYHALLAEGMALNNKMEEAFSFIDQALTLARETGEHRLDAEIYRIKGEIYLKKDNPDEAKACLKKALKIAEQQGASLFENRAIHRIEQLS